MGGHRSRWAAGRFTDAIRWVALVVPVGCGPDPGVLTLTIEDPTRKATGTNFIALASESGPLGEPLATTGAFPVTAVLTADDGTAGQLFIEARRGEQPLARATVTLRFDVARSEAISAQLAILCQRDADCADESFCNGEEVCTDGLCQTSVRACLPPAIPCVVVSCVEERRACEVSIDPALDDDNPCTVDLCSPAGADHRPVEDGSPCNLAPEGSGVCVGGECVP